MAVEIRPAVPADGLALAANLRDQDRAEIAAYGWVHDVEAEMVANIQRSALCWTAEDEGRLVAVFGVAPMDGHPRWGSPWMLGTPLLAQHSRVLVRVCPGYIERMQVDFPYLFNYVHAGNTRSIGWLKRLGFTVEPATRYGTAGAMFHPFFKV